MAASSATSSAAPLAAPADVSREKSPPSTSTTLRPFNARHPAAPAAFAFATGIALDRWLNWPWELWLTAAIPLTFVWLGFLCFGWNRVAVGVLIGLGVCVGGARHHEVWSTGGASEVSLFASDEPALIRLSGRVADQPEVQRRQKDPWRSAWPRADFSTTTIDCHWIETTDGPVAVSGFAQVHVTGHLLHVSVGDDVEIIGWLTRPNAPRNPGEFDARNMLRQEGAGCVVRTDHPDGVRRINSDGRPLIETAIHDIRAEIDAMFTTQLSARTMPLASSLILGDRAGLTREVRDAFAESGMMHVLAISGQNVGILAALLLLLCRWFGVAARGTAALIAVVTLCYAGLTLGEPPILRATVMILFLVLGRPWHRSASLANLLAAAALLLLLWSPGDLFDVGAQLSFLAVVGMGWFESSGVANRVLRPTTAELLEDQPGLIAKTGRGLGRIAFISYGVTAAVWIFTLPLVAARFHIVSPVGFLINVLLAPLVVIVLWLGYLFALGALLFPPAARLIGPTFDFSLGQFLSLVESASQWKLAWFHVPSIPAWWLAGYYAVLAAVLLGGVRRWVARPAILSLLVWIVVGLTVELIPSGSGELRVRFLSVGHGGAVLVEMPNGKTLLYDAGAIHDADYAQRTVEHALWHDHRRGIDAMVISHADVDHFNGAPGLLRSVSVGTLCVARPFLDFDQELVRMLCDEAGARDVPIRIIGRGDRLQIDDNVRVEVLHPPADRMSFDDNANSVTLLIEYAGRKILLAGDLSGVGLDALLSEPSQQADVLLAPHHGSLLSNPQRLADWARPELVVVSSGRTSTLPVLRERYHGTVTSTFEAGAVTVCITSAGELKPDVDRLHTR